jgi:hypothetical protein
MRFFFAFLVPLIEEKEEQREKMGRRERETSVGKRERQAWKSKGGLTGLTLLLGN